MVNDPARIHNWHEHAYFGMHYDLHGHEDELPGFCAEVDEEQLVRLWSKLKPDWVQCDGKGHPGYTSWFCDIGWRTPTLVKDDVAAYRNASRRLGLPLVIHYSTLLDGKATRVHPEWAARDLEGKQIGQRVCLTGDYFDQLMIPQLIELIDKYDVDGFWLDAENWGATPCWCERCRKRFTAETGIAEVPENDKDPHWNEWLEFFRELFRRHVAHYTAAVHARKPDCLVCSNWMYSLRQPEKIAIGVDYLSGDFTPRFGADRAALEGRFFDGRGKSWDLLVWGFVCNPAIPLRNTSQLMKSVLHLSQECAESIALGGATVIYLVPQRDGRLSESEHRIAAEVAEKFILPRRKYCFGTRSASEIALLHHTDSFYARNNALFLLGNAHDALEGALHLMQENHLSADILASCDFFARLGDYKMVVLPEVAFFSEAEKEALRHYAADGGIVLGFGASFAADFAAELGVGLDGEAIQEPEYDRTNLVNHRRRTALRFGGFGCSLPGPVQPVRPLDGAVGLARLYPTPDGDCRPGEEKLLATAHRYGKGCFAGLYGPVCTLYIQSHYFVVRDLVGDLIGRLPFRQRVRVEAPAHLELILRRRDGELLVNLINRGAAEMMTPQRLVMTAQAPVNDVKVTVTEGAKYRDISVFPEIPGFRVERRGDGAAEIVLPRVDIHSVIVLKDAGGEAGRS